jgi:hypothetical protein
MPGFVKNYRDPSQVARKPLTVHNKRHPETCHSGPIAVRKDTATTGIATYPCAGLFSPRQKENTTSTIANAR